MTKLAAETTKLIICGEIVTTGFVFNYAVIIISNNPVSNV